MAPILLRIAIRTVLCALATWWIYGKLGLVALPIGAPLLGAALARPIIDLLEELHQSGRERALKEAQGRYWAFRNMRIDIAHDVDDKRWLLLADVRKVLPALPRDEVMQRRFGERVSRIEPDPGLRIRADALAEYLRDATDASSLKFRTWLDRVVMGGSRNPRSKPQSNASV